MDEENDIIREVLKCSKNSKSEGANICSYLLDYKDIINPDYFSSQFIQDINYLDYNLKNENLMLNQLVDKLEDFNKDKYPKKWIKEQLNDAAQRLVNANHFSEYLESLTSSLHLNKDPIDQSVLAKYNELVYQIKHTQMSIEKENKDIGIKSTDLFKIDEELKQLKSDKSFLLDTNTSQSSPRSQETRNKIEQQPNLENRNRNNESKKTPGFRSPRQNLILTDFKLDQHINQDMKAKLSSSAEFYKIDVDTGNCFSSKNTLDFTNTMVNLINNKVLNETTVNLFIVILEDDYQKINFSFKEIIPKIRHELNVYLICRSSVLNLIKMPENRGTLKIKRETTDNYAEWSNIVQRKINQQEQVENARSAVPELKRSNNATTTRHLETVKVDQGGREEEQNKLQNERLKARQLELSTLQNRRKEIQSELDIMVNTKAYKENSLKEKQTLLNDLEPQRNAVLAKLKAEVRKATNTNPRLYQLEAKLNPSIDYLRILCQRRELLLNYIEQIKSFIINQYSNEGVQTSIPPQIRNMLDFLRLKPYSD